MVGSIEIFIVKCNCSHVTESSFLKLANSSVQSQIKHLLKMQDHNNINPDLKLDCSCKEIFTGKEKKCKTLS